MHFSSKLKEMDCGIHDGEMTGKVRSRTSQGRCMREAIAKGSYDQEKGGRRHLLRKPKSSSAQKGDSEEEEEERREST